MAVYEQKRTQHIFHGMQYQHLVAGLTGGFVSTLVVHPIDLLKVRFAANDGNAAIRPQYGGYWLAMKKIYGVQGVAGLYKGVTPNLWGATCSWGFYFMFYNYIKDFIRVKCDVNELKPVHTLSSGVLAGCLTLAMTNPLWVAKTRLCLQYENQQQQYTTLRHTLWTILKKEGFIRGWYRGFLPGLIGTTHGALNFMAYDDLKLKLEPLHFQPWFLHLVCAALSKMFAASLTYPYQVVRTRLQDHHVIYDGVGDVVSKIWRLEGTRGFYKGLWACLLKVTPASCVTFIVYEEVYRLLPR